MKKTTLFFLCFLLITCAIGQNQLPVISNVEVSLGTGNVMTILFDLEDAENDPLEITFRATEKGGQVFDFETSNATGDVGDGIMPGSGKSIEWDYSAHATGMADFRLMLIAADGQPVDIQALVEEVDSTRLMTDLDVLEGVRHRTTGSALLEDTKEFIQFQFMENGLETYQQEFFYSGYQAANIIGRKAGTESESALYILDGHFDTVNNSPGADDNGSAVAGVLEALRVLAPYGFKKSIKFIGFDLEEEGLVGSIRYVQDGILPNETIEGVLNLEMIGYYSESPNSQEVPLGFEMLYPDVYDALVADEFRGNFVNSVGDFGSAALLTAFNDAAATYVPDLKVLPLEAPIGWQVIVPDLGRSDHAPFWLAEHPALMLTDGANFRNDNYHSPNDKIETLNFTFMHNVTKAAVATLAELAEIQHATTWWVDTEFVTPTSEVKNCAFTISPNPVHDFLQISWPTCQTGQLNIKLMDIHGKVVRQYLNRNGSSIQQQMVDVRELERGIYFLKIQGRKGEKVERVIVH